MKSKKHIIEYFLRSKTWNTYEEEVTNNYVHWVVEDPERAERMYANVLINRKGYTVQEYLYDMLDCIFKAHIAKKTKDRLIKDLDALEEFHNDNGTLESVL